VLYARSLVSRGSTTPIALVLSWPHVSRRTPARNRYRQFINSAASSWDVLGPDDAETDISSFFSTRAFRTSRWWSIPWGRTQASLSGPLVAPRPHKGPE
jgi:hypothetical protein